MKRNATLRLVVAALFTAAGVVMPALFHSAWRTVGSVFLPMHIPVLLCGFLCGWPYGLACGAITPVLSSILTGMPPIFPTAVSMACELAAYGAFSGLFYDLLSRLLPERPTLSVLASLVIALLLGRAVMGLVNTLLYSAQGNAYTFAAFLTGAFVNALPGIAIQLIALPILVPALYRVPGVKALKRTV